MDAPSVTILDNGATVVLVPIVSNTCTVAVAVRGGAIVETVDKKGITHLLEHIILDTNEMKIFESAGSLNGETHIDATVYRVSSLSENFCLCFERLLILIFEPRFREDRLEAEGRAVKQEASIRRGANFLGDLIFEAAYGNSLSMDGAAAPIQFEMDSVRQWWEHTYCGENIVVAVVGNFDPEGVLTICRNHMSHVPRGLRSLYPHLNSVSGSIVKNNGRSPTYAAVAVPCANYNATENLHQNVVVSILGGGVHSRALLLRREMYGHTASPSVFCMQRGSARCIVLDMYLDTRESGKIEHLLREAWKNITDTDVSAHEMQRSKDRMRYEISAQADSIEGILRFYLTGALLNARGEMLSLEMYIDIVRGCQLYMVNAQLAQLRKASHGLLIIQ